VPNPHCQLFPLTIPTLLSIDDQHILHPSGFREDIPHCCKAVCAIQLSFSSLPDAICAAVVSAHSDALCFSPSLPSDLPVLQFSKSYSVFHELDSFMFRLTGMLSKIGPLVLIRLVTLICPVAAGIGRDFPLAHRLVKWTILATIRAVGNTPNA